MEARRRHPDSNDVYTLSGAVYAVAAVVVDAADDAVPFSTWKYVVPHQIGFLPSNPIVVILAVLGIERWW